MYSKKLIIIIISLSLSYGFAYADAHLVVNKIGRLGPYSQWNTHIIPNIIASADRKHTAYISGVTGAESLVLDGVVEKTYSEIDDYTFSPDSNHFAYTARVGGQVKTDMPGYPAGFPVLDGGKYVFVLDGQESPAYDEIMPGVTGEPESPKKFFSPDSQHYVFAARKGTQWVIVQDGHEGPAYDEVRKYPKFSPDSQHYVYAARKGAQWMVVLDGQEGHAYTALEDFIWDNPVFSPDSNHLVYVAVVAGGKQVLVEDSKEGLSFEEIPLFLYGPDSSHLAYIAKLDDTHEAVIVDGVQSPVYDCIINFSFSPDSQHTICTTRQGGTWTKTPDFTTTSPNGVVTPSSDTSFDYNGGKTVIIVDGKAYNDATDATFSPDSKHLVFVVKKGTRYVVVLDGAESVSYDAVGIVSFTAGNQLLYEAKRDKHWFMVTDSHEGEPYYRIVDDIIPFPFMSPFGNGVAYLATKDNYDNVIVVNGHESASYLSNGGYSFSFPEVLFNPDGSHYVYDVQKGDKMVIVMDGLESPLYDHILPGGFYFASPTTVRALVVEGTTIVEIELTVTNGP